MSHDVHFSSQTASWFSPENVLSAVREFIGGQIGLDPCWEHGCDTDPSKKYTAKDNGLTADWQGFGPVYVNPPYGRSIPKWTGKIVREAEQGCEVVALLPSRTDTAWWHCHVATATRVLLWRGRLKFKGATSSAPFPSALAYWGPHGEEFDKVFGKHGMVVCGG